jgi:hypothetical protein
MAQLSDRVPIPPKDTINTNLSSATEQIMLRKFGKPGALTESCSPPNGRFVRRVKSEVDVGPFKVSGLDFAVESLRQLFAEVEQQHPPPFKHVKTDGMLCVRHRRSNPARFRTTAGERRSISFSGDRSSRKAPSSPTEPSSARAVLQPARVVLGGEFSGDSVDAMHFELAEETILKIHGPPL